MPKSPEEFIKRESSEATERLSGTVIINDVTYLKAKAEIGPDKKVRFLEDIEVDELDAYSPLDFDALIEAGILPQKPSRGYDTSRSNYILKKNGWSGWLYVKKEDINKAIQEGRLDIIVDSAGDILIG